MQAIAKYNNANSSVQKVRLIINLIRGEYVLKSLVILTFLNKKASRLVKKVLESAIANIKYNYNNVDINTFKIFKIFANEGFTRKKIISRAKGRSNIIRKRSSHIIIIISNIY